MDRHSRDCALLARPLSQAWRARLADSLGGAPDELAIAALRAAPWRDGLRRLRALDAERLVLPLESDHDRCFLPVLTLLAAASGAGAIVVVPPDLKPQPISRLRAVPALIATLAATVTGLWAKGRCAWHLARLVRAPRRAAAPGAAKSVLYLNNATAGGGDAGGAVAHMAGVVNGLVDLGYTVDAVIAAGAGLLREAVRVHPIPPLAGYALPGELNLYRQGLATAREARAIARTRRPGFIYQRMTLGDFSGVRAARASGLPLVLEYNGSEVWIAGNWGTPLRFEGIARRAEEACLRHALLIVTVSAVLRDELIGRGIEAGRIVVHPNGADVARFDPARFSDDDRSALRRRYGIATDAVVLTFVGTFGRWHGATALAAAIRQLADDEPGSLAEHKVHALFVGDGAERPAAEAMLAGAAAARCTFTGIVPAADVPLHLAASDVLLSPHVPNADGAPFFGSPTKLFEYLAMARPVIASELGQIGEVLAGAPHVADLDHAGADPDAAPHCAILARPGDIGELARAIRFAVGRPDWRAAAGESGRRLAVERYSWRAHVSRILDALACPADGDGGAA